MDNIIIEVPELLLVDGNLVMGYADNPDSWYEVPSRDLWAALNIKKSLDASPATKA